MTCNRGTYPALASSRPVQQPFITAPVADLLDRWRYKAVGGSWSGRGVMSVMGEGSKRVFTAALFQGSLSSMTLAKASRYGEPEKIRLNFVVSFGVNSCIPFTALFSLSILVSEIINSSYTDDRYIICLFISLLIPGIWGVTHPRGVFVSQAWKQPDSSHTKPKPAGASAIRYEPFTNNGRITVIVALRAGQWR